ncbi:small GTP-binding protein [Histomonas meleagridis]|uniref:small GTP-binding protein n=1 Tax=Histomonas meleagridis TaxID=135588 RepID=UPI00355A77C5|nr:small GTP-binding protein [Histomonas meleagridis]KAH0806799.1 small GTP-binding protein [Histomonas meleagridis]
MKMNVTLIGDSGVGKTAIINRFVNGIFNNLQAPNVAGVNINKQIQINEQTINMKIWDTAGQEAYRSIAPIYYQHANVIIIVFAVGNDDQKAKNSRESFKSVNRWYNQVQEFKEGVTIVLCGNKIDLQNREISFNEGAKKAKTLPDVIEYYETSALSGDGIFEMFQEICEKFIESNTHDNSHDSERQDLPLGKFEPSDNNLRCC